MQKGISSLKWVPGSNGVVCFGDEPGEVPEPFIQVLKHKVNRLNEEPQAMWAKYRKGDPVHIKSGPFEGYQAVFDQYIP
jgi:transcription antitermination factor NusG